MKRLKELLKNKAAVAVLGVLLVLGVCDMTVLEESNLKKVMTKIQDVVSSVAGSEEEEKLDSKIAAPESSAVAAPSPSVALVTFGVNDSE